MNLYITSPDKQSMVFSGISENEAYEAELKAKANIGDAYSIYSFTDFYKKSTFSHVRSTIEKPVPLS